MSCTNFLLEAVGTSSMRFVVTIDGPAGSGKSTIARRLAGQLGWRLLDTGAMYRAVTVAALRAEIDLEDEKALGELAARTTVRLLDDRVLLDGEDVTTLIRSVDVTRATKYIAGSPRVRTQLVEWQRLASEDNHLVTEGRDQGTVVFPEAFCKFYLTASLEERARRRHEEFTTKGQIGSIEIVRKDLSDRDDGDASRTIAPMKPADDAILIDTTDMDLDQVLTRIESEVRARLQCHNSPS
ncbi:(d)CMP kinase [Singulisphaera sp. PoT]|uniref:(d)CMP kinase n=1 Tax=Singulisphaera sp. PoT TaxID=3411797 RepID=UPI003BF49BE3